LGHPRRSGNSRKAKAGTKEKFSKKTWRINKNKKGKKAGKEATDGMFVFDTQKKKSGEENKRQNQGEKDRFF